MRWPFDWDCRVWPWQVRLRSTGERVLEEILSESHRLDEALTYASDIGVLGVLRGLTRLRGLILLPIIARGLGVATYGAWTQSLVVVSIGTSVILLQLDAALVRFVSGTNDRSSQRAIFLPILSVVLSLGVLATVTTILVPRIIASFVLGGQEYVSIASWLGVWMALTAIGQLGSQLQRGLHRVKLYGVLSTGETIGQLVIVAVAILWTGELLPAVWGAVAWEFLYVLLVLILGFRSVGIGRPQYHSLPASLRFSLPLVPSYLAATVLNFADRIFITAFLGAGAVGVYAAAYSLARVVREISVPVSTALFPAVSRAWDRGDKSQSRWLLSNTLRYYLMLAIPAMTGLGILGSQFLEMLAPGVIARSMGPLILLIGLGCLFSGGEATFAIVLQLVQNTKALALAKGVAALVYIPLVVLAVPQWGLVGGAVSSALGYGIDLGLAFLLSWRYVQFPLPLIPSAKATLAAGGMALLIGRLGRHGIADLALSLAVGGLAYAGLLVLLRGVGTREVRFARSLLIRGLNGIEQEGN